MAFEFAQVEECARMLSVSHLVMALFYNNRRKVGTSDNFFSHLLGLVAGEYAPGRLCRVQRAGDFTEQRHRDAICDGFTSTADLHPGVVPAHRHCDPFSNLPAAFASPRYAPRVRCNALTG